VQVGIRHAHLFCIDDVHDDATLLEGVNPVEGAQGHIKPQDMHTFSIWARPDLTCRSEIRKLSHRIELRARRPCKRKKSSE
jgi:hypothetical protein